MKADAVLNKVNKRLSELEYATSYFNKKVSTEISEIRSIIRDYLKSYD